MSQLKEAGRAGGNSSGDRIGLSAGCGLELRGACRSEAAMLPHFSQSQEWLKTQGAQAHFLTAQADWMRV